MTSKFDEELDLVLERTVDVPPRLVWLAWTTPAHLMKWFTPVPWQTVECEIDLKPGGIFRTVMQSPEGQKFPNLGCYLEVVPEKRLVWTDALLPGYRPANRTQISENCGMTAFTAVIELEPHGAGGTRYRATALHKSKEERASHEKMGFHDGWGTVLTQLVEVMKKL